MSLQWYLHTTCAVWAMSAWCSHSSSAHRHSHSPQGTLHMISVCACFCCRPTKWRSHIIWYHSVDRLAQCMSGSSSQRSAWCHTSQRLALHLLTIEICCYKRAWAQLHCSKPTFTLWVVYFWSLEFSSTLSASTNYTLATKCKIKAFLLTSK